MVDKVLSWQPEEGQNGKIVGIKNVTINESFFQGHFPGNPIMPGFLIGEHMAQLGGIAAYLVATAQGENTNKLGVLSVVDGLKFKGFVKPGDQLITEVELLRVKNILFTFSAKTKVDNKLVAEIKLALTMLIDKDKHQPTKN